MQRAMPGIIQDNLRVQAAYSGIFLLIAIFWGWGIDRVAPDKFDIIGAVVALIGMLIIMYAPRG
jgi:small multidrug resistance family-3 protein